MRLHWSNQSVSPDFVMPSTVEARKMDAREQDMSSKIQDLKSISRREFLDLLDSVRGRKGLVLDHTISGVLSLVAEFPVVKERGVEKIYHLKPGPLVTELDTLIYITRADMKCMSWIAGASPNIRSLKS